MDGSVPIFTNAANSMDAVPLYIELSLQQIPYDCQHPSFEFQDLSDILEPIYVSAHKPSKCKKKNANDVTVQPLEGTGLKDPQLLLSEPNSQVISNPEPQLLPLFPESYGEISIPEPFALNLKERVKQALSNAWQFDAVERSILAAREATPESVLTPCDSFTSEVRNWLQAHTYEPDQVKRKEEEEDSNTAKQFLAWESHFFEDDETALGEELDDFYGLGPVATRPLETPEVDEAFDDSFCPIVPTASASRTKRTLILNTQASTTDRIPKNSGVCMDGAFIEASFPEQPPSFAKITVPGKLDNENLGESTPLPTFNVKLAPLGKSGRYVPFYPLFGGNLEIAWESRREGPYDLDGFLPFGGGSEQYFEEIGPNASLVVDGMERNIHASIQSRRTTTARFESETVISDSLMCSSDGGGPYKLPILVAKPTENIHQGHSLEPNNDTLDKSSISLQAPAQTPPSVDAVVSWDGVLRLGENQDATLQAGSDPVRAQHINDLEARSFSPTGLITPFNNCVNVSPSTSSAQRFNLIAKDDSIGDQDDQIFGPNTQEDDNVRGIKSDNSLNVGLPASLPSNSHVGQGALAQNVQATSPANPKSARLVTSIVGVNRSASEATDQALTPEAKTPTTPEMSPLTPEESFCSPTASVHAVDITNGSRNIPSPSVLEMPESLAALKTKEEYGVQGENAAPILQTHQSSQAHLTASSQLNTAKITKISPFHACPIAPDQVAVKNDSAPILRTSQDFEGILNLTPHLQNALPCNPTPAPVEQLHSFRGSTPKSCMYSQSLTLSLAPRASLPRSAKKTLQSPAKIAAPALKEFKCVENVFNSSRLGVSFSSAGGSQSNDTDDWKELEKSSENEEDDTREVRHEIVAPQVASGAKSGHSATDQVAQAVVVPSNNQQAKGQQAKGPVVPCKEKKAKEAKANALRKNKLAEDQKEVEKPAKKKLRRSTRDKVPPKHFY